MAGLTDERPKCLIEIGGRPLIAWQLDALRGVGVGEIAVVTGYRRELLSPLGLIEFHNPRWHETNMVASLACAAEWLERTPCLVAYSDLYYEAAGLAALIDADADIAITYDPEWEALWRRRFGDPLLDAETFRLDADGRVAEIGNKPASLAEIEGQYMGLLRYTPAGWAEARRVWQSLEPPQRDRTHMTGLLQLLIEARTMPVRAIPYRARWAEFDAPQDVAALDLPSASKHHRAP